MLRYLMYCSSTVLAFFIGVFVALSFHWKADERFVNVQRSEKSDLVKIINPNQMQPSQDDDLPWLLFDELAVNGIRLGTSHPTVLRQLGKPLQTKKTGVYPCGDLEKTLRYSGLVIKLERDNKSRGYKVVSIEITSPKWSISGIRVGVTMNDVKTRFKNSYHKTKESGSEGLHYGNGDGGTSFYFRDNKLTMIKLEYNWC